MLLQSSWAPISLTGHLCMRLYQIQGEHCPINVALACCRIKMTSYLLFFIILRDTKSRKMWYLHILICRFVLKGLAYVTHSVVGWVLHSGCALIPAYHQREFTFLFPYFLFSDGIIWWYRVGTRGFSNNLKKLIGAIRRAEFLEIRLYLGSQEFPFLTTSDFQPLLFARVCWYVFGETFYYL